MLGHVVVIRVRVMSRMRSFESPWAISDPISRSRDVHVEGKVGMISG